MFTMSSSSVSMARRVLHASRCISSALAISNPLRSLRRSFSTGSWRRRRSWKPSERSRARRSGPVYVSLSASLPVAAVAAYPLITIGRLGSAEVLGFETYQAFREQGFEPEAVQATNQPQTLISLVRANLGIDTNSEMAGLSSEAILNWAKGAIDRRADACLISCT